MRNIKHIQLKDMEEIGENDEEFEIDGDDIIPRKKSEFQSTQNKSTFKRLFDYLTETNFRKSLLIIAFCSLFIILTITATLTTKVQIIYSNIKLPGNVIPIHYFTHVDIRMEPKFNFNGTIVSTLNITSDKNDFIVIHADETTLSLNSIHLVSVPKYNSSKPVNSTDFDLDGSITPTNKIYNAENSYYILFFKDLKKFLDKNGSIFNLYISYNGSLVDAEGTSTLRGLYLSSYKNPNNRSESKYLAVTQFEPVDARLSFPCFDEPSLKANWTIWITHPNDYKALSNMPDYLIQENKQTHKTTTRFDTTPKMSSYLVCIVVHQFSSKSGFIERHGSTGGGVEASVPLRIWAADHLMDTVDFSLDMAKKSFVFFEDYFDILYPLPKMDLVAIPDFAAGAMENFGLMTFRESDLLYSSKTSDQENKQRVAEVVSHEIAHQWFGDLVTMKWWNDLWLNEGFATFMSYKCMQKVLIQEFNSEEIFQYSSKQPGLDIDASPFTHTISNNYTDPLDIMASFDSVTYDKGSSILLMLESMVDRVRDNAFRDGIRKYLKKYAYSNAETNDLWEMLYDSINRDPNMVIPDIMNQWTTYPGFPQIKIDTIGTTGNYRITQSKFTQPNTTRPSDFNTNSLWWIPIKVIDNCNNTDDLYISNKSVQYKGWSDQGCGVATKDSYIFANSDATGFYRTLYDTSIFDKIVNKLNEAASDHFTTLQRISFADDLYAFSKIGAIPTSVALKTFNYTTVSSEPNFVVWKDILSFLSFVHNRLETADAPCYIQYIKKAQYIFNHGLLPLIQLDIDPLNNNLTYNELELRKSAFSKVNSLSITFLRSHLYKIYLDNINTPENIDPSIRGPLFSSIIQNGDIEEYEWVVDRFENTNAINERIDALKAISNPKNPQLIRNTLKMLLDGKIKNQDFYMVFLEMSYSPFARELAWNFLLDNFNFISENSTPGDIGKYVTYFASSMDSQAKIDQIKQFFTDAHPIPASSLANAISSIQYNMNWLKNQAPELCNFLNK